MPLPPRAPELNGQENIWQVIRQNWLSNRVQNPLTISSITAATPGNTFIDQPWKIMSIARRDRVTVVTLVMDWY